MNKLMILCMLFSLPICQDIFFPDHVLGTGAHELHGSILDLRQDSIEMDSHVGSMIPKIPPMIPEIPPLGAPQPLLPLIAPSPLAPFTNASTPKLSGYFLNAAVIFWNLKTLMEIFVTCCS